MESEIISKLESLLAQREAVRIRLDGDYIDAAVMMILRYTEGGFSMLFIKRPDSINDPFSGHIALPGGKMNEGDGSKVNAAIRETLEEVGIDIKLSGRVIGALDDVNPNNPRAKHYVVTPYLSLLEQEVRLTLCPDEAEAAMWIPLRHLTDDKNFTIRVRERSGKEIEDYVYNYKKYIIWGMTGRILRQFILFSGHLFR